MKKKSLPVFFVGLLMCGCQMKEVINEYNVVPLPVTMNEQPGRFYLNSDVPVVVNASQEVKNIASSLSTTVLDVAGIKLKPGGELHENVPTIVFDSIPGMEKEAYKLSVTPQQIKITASTPNGFYYGLQTLYQLLPVAIYSKERARNAEWSVPCVEIEDTPAFRYRGAMLDVCRHFASIDYIKKFIDVLAVHKMNTFHWHLTDDQGWRIEIKKYPKLTEIGSQRSETMVDYFYTHYPFKYDGKPHGGYYTQEEIKEVVAYAQSKYITVIPEIELPGHALAAIASYPELSCTPDSTYEVCKLWGVFDQVFCPTDTFFQFMEGVMDEVVELFPSSYIHIGGDECPKYAWEHCSHCQKLIRDLGLKDDVTPNPVDGRKHTKEEKLQSYIVNRAEKYLNSKGRNIIGWDEILEAILRTKVQHCSNSNFVFAGSQRHIMMNIFNSPSRPFYQSVSMMHLGAIPLEVYKPFVKGLFEENGKKVTDQLVENVYTLFDGHTWYVQLMLNELFILTDKKGICDVPMINLALNNIIATQDFTFQEIFSRLPEKQKEIMIAIAKEQKAKGVTSAAFIKKYRLTSASSVQSGLKGLLEKDMLTQESGGYQVYDRLFNIWLRRNY